MKRRNHLFENIIDLENLYLAYWKARKGKEGERKVQHYAENLNENIQRLRGELESGDIRVGGYNSFKIFDPKERTICSVPFQQRVMHHALMNVCVPVMDSYQIYDSYANRKGKGTFAAIERARKFHRRYDWCVKMDVRKYFDSIDHSVLKCQLGRLFREKKVLGLFGRIIDSYCHAEGKGLPIGNLTSQYCANHYLAVADHYAKERLAVKGYVRYMDDVLMYGDNREELKKQAQVLRDFLEVELKLGLKVLEIRNTSHTMQFLGYILTRGRLLLSRRSMVRYRDRLRLCYRQYDCGCWGETELARHLSPVVAFAQKADSLRYRKMLRIYK